MNRAQVDIQLKGGQTISTSMEEPEVRRLSDDFVSFVTSDNPQNSGGVYNGANGNTVQSIFLTFDSVSAIVVNGMNVS